jgi:dipeptidyl aminopeptidase/acylaminoacyl peptidase
MLLDIPERARRAKESFKGAGVAELIPIEVLFGNPERVAPQVSPDGRRLAFIAPRDDVLNVWVGEVGEDAYRPVTKDTDRGIRFCRWAFDNRHILYIQDSGGDENWHLHRVDVASGEVVDLTPFDGVQTQFVALNKDFPDELLIALNKDDRRLHDAYHLDLRTGALDLVAKNPGTVLSWIADRRLRVRAAHAAAEDGGFDLLVRNGSDSGWEKLLSWTPEEALNSGPLGFTKDGGSIYLRDSRASNASRLVKVDVAGAQLEVVAEDPIYDVTFPLFHPDTYEVQAVAFAGERLEWTVLDDSVRDDFDRIEKLHHGDHLVVGRDAADRAWVVQFVAPDAPTAYYILDRRRGDSSFLFHERPRLNAYELAPTKPFSVTARDGLVLHGYITFPPGGNDERLPTVLYVHGGPWGRDLWWFDSVVQWLANRGYLVVQVNFRGSTGYGKEFVNAGDREWAGKMHDDLIDTVRWAVDAGHADAERVAIMGGSYGGYAALVGATFTPDVFCCAIDVCGPSNLVTLVKTTPPYWKNAMPTFYRRVGHPERDEEFL